MAERKRAARGGRTPVPSALSCEAWVRLFRSSEVAELGRRRSLALERGLRSAVPAARLLSAQDLAHPAFASWAEAAGRLDPDDRRARDRHAGLLGGAAAGAAFASGRPASIRAWVDRDGHVHLPTLRKWIELDPRWADRPALIAAGPRGLKLALEGGPSLAVGRELLHAGARGGAFEGGAVRAAPLAAASVEVQTCDPLILWPIHVHGAARLEGAELAAFRATLASALEEMRVVDPLLHGEIVDGLKVLVPLENPKGLGSVSSTYKELPGVVCLSSSDDALLQQETLIHEYCHSKLNLLSEYDPLILPGQRNAVFYSPWREDPRPLRGLLLGAHAFLNVGLHLLNVVERRPETIRLRPWALKGVARRTFQVDVALRTVAAYAKLTPLGSAIVTEIFRHLAILQGALEAFPASIVEEARSAAEEHRRARALGGTFVHVMSQAPLS